MTIVFNLETGEEMIFTTSPIESLISAAIMADKKTSSLHNPQTRDYYRARIILGTRSAAIDNLATLLR